MLRKPVILYVEDNVDDEHLVRRALENAGIGVTLHRVGSVPAARAYLMRTPPYDDQEWFPIPDMVITDLSGHDLEGSSFDLVEWIRSQPQLQKLKVLCSTGNEDPKLWERLRALGVHCYTKSHNMRGLVEAIQA